MNLNSTFEKKNLMISLEGAIFISNWFKLGGYEAQEYLSPAIFRRLTNLLGVLASSSFEPEQIPNAECVKKWGDNYQVAHKIKDYWQAPTSYLSNLLVASIIVLSIRCSLIISSTLNFDSILFKRAQYSRDSTAQSEMKSESSSLSSSIWEVEGDWSS